MKETEKVDIVIEKGQPLQLSRAGETWRFGTMTLKDGGYMEILADCAVEIDVLEKEGGESGIGPDDPKDLVLSGFDGETGQVGADGEPGGAGAEARVTIYDLRSDLYVVAYGGGKGGRGGRGGNGGNGGDSEPGGAGGDGGSGGPGGDGGSGGSGGLLKLSYAAKNGSSIWKTEAAASGGEAGRGGIGGRGGQGTPCGRNGAPGADGHPGKNGSPGTVQVYKITEIGRKEME